MKKISISLIFLIASSLTFTESNQLLDPKYQSGSYIINNDVDTNVHSNEPQYPPKGGPQQPRQQDNTPLETPEVIALKKKINNKIDRLAKNEDKDEIKDFFRTTQLYTDLTELKKVEKYVDVLFEDYDNIINCLHFFNAYSSNDSFLYLVNRKKNIDQKIDALSKTANHALDGVSLAVAMANLPTVSSEYNHNISASYGTYAGSHSFALGLSGHIANDRLSYKLSGAVNTKGNLAFGVGVGVNLGKKNQSNKELLDRIEKLENLVKQLQNK